MLYPWLYLRPIIYSGFVFLTLVGVKFVVADPFTNKNDLYRAVREYCEDPNEWVNSTNYTKYG